LPKSAVAATGIAGRRGSPRRTRPGCRTRAVVLSACRWPTSPGRPDIR